MKIDIHGPVFFCTALQSQKEAFSYPFIDQAFTKNFFADIFRSGAGKGNLQLDLVNANVSSMRGEVKKKDHDSVRINTIFFPTPKNREIWPLQQKKELIWHISEKKLFFKLNVGRWRPTIDEQRLGNKKSCLPK